ncbi:MAG: phosphatase PAP2 family protein [Ruminococcaceae bacterium]|nr:phosphatase PAP2 family protein [Oscillospiraceae bacterium]
MKNKKTMLFGIAGTGIFIIWTFLIKTIDVRKIGPKGSEVGFASLNGFFHNITGVNFGLYDLTDWLGLVPVCFMFGFSFLGLVQLLKRKNLLKVDNDILILGGFYLVLAAVYLFFEKFVINYRPVLINGILEASYPSSTTLLTLCVMPSSAILLDRRIKEPKLRKAAVYIIGIFTVFMVFARLVSGVHWITDIIGGIFLSIGLVFVYYSLTE